MAANQILTITEPAQLAPLGPREFQIRCWKGMRFEVEQSPDLQTWASLGVVTNETGTLTFQDTQGGPQAACCFYRVIATLCGARESGSGKAAAWNLNNLRRS